LTSTGIGAALAADWLNKSATNNSATEDFEVIEQVSFRANKAYIKKRFRNPDDLLPVDLSPFPGRNERSNQSSEAPGDAGTPGRTRNNRPCARRGPLADLTPSSSNKAAQHTPDDAPGNGAPCDVSLAPAFPDRHPNDLSAREGFLSFPGARH
jgi:hypothetical protein